MQFTRGWAWANLPGADRPVRRSHATERAVIEKPEIKDAKGTDLKRAVAIGFDESFTALEECFYDLSDEAVRTFPIPGRKNIAWIVMHSLMNLDTYGPFTLSFLREDAGQPRTCYDWRASPYHMDAVPQPGDAFPTVREMLERLHCIRSKTFGVLNALSSEDLLKPIRDWWTHAADACMRTIWHSMAHVRQVWLLRGAMGWREGQSWPHQHWA
jgi:hypothetical protein